MTELDLLAARLYDMEVDVGRRVPCEAHLHVSGSDHERCYRQLGDRPEIRKRIPQLDEEIDVRGDEGLLAELDLDEHGIAHDEGWSFEVAAAVDADLHANDADTLGSGRVGHLQANLGSAARDDGPGASTEIGVRSSGLPVCGGRVPGTKSPPRRVASGRGTSAGCTVNWAP